MVVIPARDEERFIGRAVRSFPHDTVIVVDDHSDDRTAEVAREAGAGVFRAPDLPRGAVGKSNACMAGARVLTSKWILFVDADTCFEPEFLDSVVAHADDRELALLSIYPRPEAGTFSERLLAPLAIALFFCGVRARSNQAAMFNGQCLLVRRDAYEFIGGHAAVLNNISEDIKLAALGTRHRMKFGIARAEACGRVQFRDAWGTIERGALRFSDMNPWGGAIIVLTAAIMALWLPVVVWLLMEHHWLTAVAFAAIPAMLTVSWYGTPRAWLTPAIAYWILPIIANGALRAAAGRPIRWKGRVI
jgi:chlorobactene glucosyltransferase